MEAEDFIDYSNSIKTFEVKKKLKFKKSKSNIILYEFRSGELYTCMCCSVFFIIMMIFNGVMAFDVNATPQDLNFAKMSLVIDVILSIISLTLTLYVYSPKYKIIFNFKEQHIRVKKRIVLFADIDHLQCVSYWHHYTVDDETSSRTIYRELFSFLIVSRNPENSILVLNSFFYPISKELFLEKIAFNREISVKLGSFFQKILTRATQREIPFNENVLELTEIKDPHQISFKT